MDRSNASFWVGQVVHHLRFDYRGVIVDVDATFGLTEEWYDAVARSRPPKDEPWYHVLVHATSQVTYVAERHLQPDDSGEPIDHPLVDQVFRAFEDGRYSLRQQMN